MKTMIVQISGKTAREIAAAIEDAIRLGKLSPDAALPSVRQLAASAGVSPPTAAAALADLRRRGLIVTKARRRSRVSPRPPVAVPRPQAMLPEHVCDLANGHPDSSLLPDMSVALARVKPRSRSYHDEPVLPELVALARAEFAEGGIRAGHICLVSGALDGVERVLGAYLAAGDRVAVEDPCYSALLDLLRAMGLVPKPVPIDDHGLLPGPLEGVLKSGVDALVLTPRGQNPTGAALDQDRADALARVIARYADLLVIEDDHQGPVAGVSGISIVRRQTRWARVRSVTKALGPDLRLAFITGDHLTISRVEGRLAVGPGWVSEILQRIVLQFMGDKGVQADLIKATHIYRERREALLRSLAEHGVGAMGRSGFNVWVPVPEESYVISALLQRGWAVAAGAPYRLESPPAVRVTTASLKVDDAVRLGADLAEVLAPSRPRRVV